MATKIPASIRYKNPGAMWGSALAIKWGAQKKAVTLNDGLGQGNNIAVFPTYVQGICAQLDLWRTSKNYRNKSFADAIRVWSGGNYVESYIAFVLKRVPGMTRNTIMNDTFWKSSMGIAFLKAQAWHEAGMQYPAPDADWIEAQRLVFGLPETGTVGIPNPTPAPTTPVHDTKWLQASLNKLGANPQLAVDGIVGPALRAAIKNYQEKNNLDADGLIGPATLREIDLDLNKPVEIKLPAPGEPGNLPVATSFWGRVVNLFKPKGSLS